MAAPATQCGTPRRRTQRSVREALSVDYAVPALFEHGFARRRLSDALRKDVDGIASSDCGARMGPIRHLRSAQNAPCPPCAVTRDPLDCDALSVNRPNAHSPPTRLAVILNCQKPAPNCERDVCAGRQLH